jgi:hypothetical protein
VGIEHDSYLYKACALNALQPPTPANWNKRNTLFSRIAEVYALLGRGESNAWSGGPIMKIQPLERIFKCFQWSSVYQRGSCGFLDRTRTGRRIILRPRDQHLGDLRI